MEALSLTTLSDEQLDAARGVTSGRASQTVYGGREHKLRQTVIALIQGQRMHDHESPDEASLLVLRGHVRLGLGASPEEVDLHQGDFLVIPDKRHHLDAVEDSVVLLTVMVDI